MTVLPQLRAVPRARRLLASLLALYPLSSLADIVFSAKVMGPVSNIYALDAEGSLNRYTSNIHWRDLDADIAADGAVVFSSNRETEAGVDLYRTSENFNIYLVPRRGAEPRQVSAGPAQDFKPRFSGDARSIAFLRRSKDGQQLAIVGRSGARERVLLSADEILDFCWSPGNNRLAVALRRGDNHAIVTISADKPRPEALVLASSQPVIALSWSPRGTHIAYVRHPLSDGSRQLWLHSLETGHGQRVSGEGIEVQEAPSWAPSGDRFVYAALVDYGFSYDEASHRKVYRGGMQIFVTDLNGDSHQLTEGEALHRRPVFSPDENRIAFLYGNTLDARQLSLRSLGVEGGQMRTLYDSVARRSSLQWQ